MKTKARFEKQTYGATVATILETDDSIVEVQERNDGVYGLIIHARRNDDLWDDLTAYLKPEHFEALGSAARRMRGIATDGANPRVIDDDAGEITVSLNGKELRGWSYKDDGERRTKMLAAREYVEGWCDGREGER